MGRGEWAACPGPCWAQMVTDKVVLGGQHGLDPVIHVPPWPVLTLPTSLILHWSCCWSFWMDRGATGPLGSVPMGAFVPREAEDEFLQILCVQKGKKLMARLLPHLSREQAEKILLTVTHHLPFLMKKDEASTSSQTRGTLGCLLPLLLLLGRGGTLGYGGGCVSILLGSSLARQLVGLK